MIACFLHLSFFLCLEDDKFTLPQLTSLFFILLFLCPFHTNVHLPFCNLKNLSHSALREKETRMGKCSIVCSIAPCNTISLVILHTWDRRVYVLLLLLGFRSPFIIISCISRLVGGCCSFGERLHLESTQAKISSMTTTTTTTFLLSLSFPSWPLNIFLLISAHSECLYMKCLQKWNSR